MFLKPKHFIFECRPNFGSFYPLPGLLRAITFSAPKPPPLQISAYATVGYYLQQSIRAIFIQLNCSTGPFNVIISSILARFFGHHFQNKKWCENENKNA